MEDLVLQLGCALGVLLLGSFHVCFVLSHDGDEYEVLLYQGRGKEDDPKTETRRGSAVGRATRRWLGGYDDSEPRWGEMRKAVLAAWPGLGLVLWAGCSAVLGAQAAAAGGAALGALLLLSGWKGFWDALGNASPTKPTAAPGARV